MRADPLTDRQPGLAAALLGQIAAGADGEFDSLPDSAAESSVAEVRVGARPPKIRYSHMAMADLLIRNPGISQNALAAAFGYTPAWISTIVNSDAFQSLLAQRRAELVDPEIRLTLEERARALAAQSLRVLQEKISKPADQVPDQLALKAAELGAKMLGMGNAPPPPPPADAAQFLPAIVERLARMRGQSPAEPPVDVAAREIPNA